MCVCVCFFFFFFFFFFVPSSSVLHKLAGTGINSQGQFKFYLHLSWKSHAHINYNWRKYWRCTKKEPVHLGSTPTLFSFSLFLKDETQPVIWNATSTFVLFIWLIFCFFSNKFCSWLCIWVNVESCWRKQKMPKHNFAQKEIAAMISVVIPQMSVARTTN